MTNLRFLSAREVFEAFPGIVSDMQTVPPDDDEPPLGFLSRLLASRAPEDAVTFCAYLLGRREAVWWGCHCHRLHGVPVNRADETALKVAEAWVREPEEHRRRTALALGLGGNHAVAGTWLALAAGGAGGTFIIDGKAGPPVPREMTAKSARSAVLISLARLPIRERARALSECIEACRRLAQGAAERS